MSTVTSIPLHLRQLSRLREAILDTWNDGSLRARLARVKRALQLRDRLLRKHGVDALDERTADVLRRPIAQRDAKAARLAIALLRRERNNLRG